MFVSADLQKIAYFLWCVTSDEPEASQIAIAWVLRNKGHINSGVNCQPELSLFHEILCDELDALKPCQKRVCPQLGAPQIWRVMTNICRVWAGDVEDITSGSKAFHVHNVLPKWAIGLQPASLIGRRFFYNLLPLHS